MPIIDLRDLSKTFSVKRKEAGLCGSLKSIIRPEFRRVEAVKGITLSLEPGEQLAFIGPNGAVRFMMLTVLPAAFVGAVPLNVVRGLDLSGLVILAMAAAVITLVSSSVFYIGLRRYESGSAINVNV